MKSGSLIGIDWPSGICTPDYYHTIGSLRFGADRTLLVASGEAAHFSATDAGGIDPGQFLPGRANPAEDLGSFRSLTLNSLAGKVLRIDKETGHGLPSNPYWDGNPTSSRSRVWVYGVRNPYRFAVRPGTGDTDPTLANPGALYIGDTGWNAYEAIHLAKVGGLNMGWPCQEGPLPQPLYGQVTQTTAGNTNVLCSAPPSAENPVGPTPPLLWWHHTNGTLSFPQGWTGYATVGGVFHEGTTYPAPYAGSYFVSDYSYGWIRYVQVDANDNVTQTGEFITGADEPVDIEWDPISGDLFYVSMLNNQVRRIRYLLSTQPHALGVRADSAVGAGPPPVPGAASPWVDLALDRDLTLTNFSATATSGWQGNGTVANPYRLLFDGVNDRVTLAAGAIPELQSPAAATVAMWIRTGADVTTSQYLFEWLEQYGAPFQGMTLALWDGRLRADLDPWVSVAAIRPNAWYHVAMTKAAGSVRVFLNGVAVYSGTHPNLGGQVSALVLGASTRLGPSSYSDFLHGSIAQAEVWPAALADGEVLALFQLGSPRYFPPGPKILTLRADSAAGGGPPAVPGAGTPWKDLLATHDADLVGFSGTTASGWQGSGTSASPYRLLFDGVDDHATISAGSVTELQSPAGYSAGVWVRTGMDVISTQYLLQWLDQYDANSAGMTLAIENGSFRVFLDPWVDIALVLPNTWYHLVVAKDAAGTRVYVDGVRRYTSPPSPIGSQNSEIVLGASTFRGAGVYGEYFNGSLAQCVVWNRGLIDPEVQEAYSHDQGLYESLLVWAKVVHLRADSATGTGPHPIPGRANPWTDLVKDHNATLSLFGGPSPTGWQGNGTTASPYRLEFDGINDRVRIPAASIPELQAPVEVTVAVWFNTGSNITATQYLLEWVQQYTPPYQGMAIGIENGWFRLFLAPWVDVFPVEPDMWYHVAVVKDATSARVYADGALAYSSDSSNLGGQLSELVLGASTYAGPSEYGEFFSGALASVSVLPIALSPAGVQALFVADSSHYDLPLLKVPFEPAYVKLSARPNPFSRTLNVEFTLPTAGDVEVAVYSVDGRRVRTLVSGIQAAGPHGYIWDGRDLHGKRSEPGVYFVRIDGPSLQVTRRVAYLR